MVRKTYRNRKIFLLFVKKCYSNKKRKTKRNAKNQEIKHNKISEFENVKAKFKVSQNKSTV